MTTAQKMIETTIPFDQNRYTLHDYETALKSFDWWYSMSDDHRAWEKGVAQRNKLIEIREYLLSIGISETVLNELFETYDITRAYYGK